MLRLAVPLILAELGWMAMGIVDTMMVGRLPDAAVAIGATAVGNMVFHVIGFFGGGILLGLDPLVSQAFGRKDIPDCNRSLVQGLYLAMFLSPPLMWLMYVVERNLLALGVDAQVAAAAQGFIRPLIWSIPALLVYFAARRYLQGLHHVKAVMFAYVAANVVNLFFNWVLIYGRLGFPAMGVAGSGWSTFIGRMFMAAALVAAVGYYSHRDRLEVLRASFRFEWKRTREILALGIPTAFQITLEVGVFAMATLIVSNLGAIPLAAHQIAITIVSTTFMVPLGVASATAVAVGHAIGGRDAEAATNRGWTGICMGAGFMALAGVVIFLAPTPILRIFTEDPAVISAGIPLLFVGAIFQFFDGAQGVASGALRGAAETRIAMACNFVGYWVIGFPLGYYLCFKSGLGAPGVWTGLCVGLIVVSIILATVWTRKTRQLKKLYAVETGA